MFKAISTVLNYTGNNTINTAHLWYWSMHWFFLARVKLVVQLQCGCFSIAFIPYPIMNTHSKSVVGRSIQVCTHFTCCLSTCTSFTMCMYLHLLVMFTLGHCRTRNVLLPEIAPTHQVVCTPLVVCLLHVVLQCTLCCLHWVIAGLGMSSCLKSHPLARLYALHLLSVYYM